MKIDKVKSHWNERWAKVETKYPTRSVWYYISDYGRLKSVHKVNGKEFLLKGNKLQRGLISANIKLTEGRNAALFIHKLVGIHFVEKTDEEQKYVVHINGDRENNHYKNLKWITQKELGVLFSKKGTYRGNSTKKMTESKVRLLRKRIKAGKTKRKILARNFGISTTQLRRIETGENWGHVK